jgi:peptidyl-prolyl cis-trans isomerase A (cyclophilin A)
MRAFLPILLGAATLLAQTPPTTKAPAKAPAKSPVAGPSQRLLHPELAKARAPELYRVKFTTSKGDFVVEVNRADAPLGADRFYNLVRIGYFTNVSFYRALSSLVQFGLSPYPAVSKAWSTAPIHDDPVKLHNVTGAITFAMAGPNTRTTQLFINLSDGNVQYDSLNFAPIGKVTEGIEIVKGLYSGYGEMAEQPGGRGPSQEKTTNEGKPYLDKNFPLLDSIKSATVIFPEPVPPAAKKAPAPATTKK